MKTIKFDGWEIPLLIDILIKEKERLFKLEEEAEEQQLKVYARAERTKVFKILVKLGYMK